MGFREFLSKIKSNLGEELIVPREQWVKFKRDWWPLLILHEILGKAIEDPPLVLKPRNIDELKLIVRLANDEKVPLVPFGGGSSVVGGSYHDGNVVIDLSELKRIIEFDEEDLLVSVEAGIRVSELETFLNEKGYTIDYHPQSFSMLTIGGAIAHKGTGSHSSSNIEELLLSLEVILPNGKLISLGPKRAIRSSMGPDLKSLFIGSEGVFGMIVSATLRIQPLANYVIDRAYSFDELDNSLKFLREYSMNIPSPRRAVIHDEESSLMMLNERSFIALARFRRNEPRLAEVEASITDKIAEKYEGRIAKEDLVKTWRKAFSRDYEEHLMRLINAGLWMDSIDAACTWSVLPRLYKELNSTLSSIEGVNKVLIRFTHPYLNGASMYSVFLINQDEETYWRVWDEAAKVILKNKATISHHHGVGLLKKKWLFEEIGDQIELIKTMKNILDPNRILNPRKFLD